MRVETNANIIMPPLRILHAEDEPSILRMVGLMLPYHGYSVVGVPNGFEALRKLAEDPYDLTITDGDMPGMTGEQLTDQIRETNQQMPILLVSGSLDDFNLEKFDAHRKKPFTISSLLSGIQQAHMNRQARLNLHRDL